MKHKNFSRHEMFVIFKQRFVNGKVPPDLAERYARQLMCYADLDVKSVSFDAKLRRIRLIL